MTSTVPFILGNDADLLSTISLILDRNVFEEKIENPVVDNFTKGFCLNKSIVLKNRTWDGKLMKNFFLSKKDLRNPINNEEWSKDEIEIICNLMNEHEKNLFNIVTKKNLPDNVKTSIIQFLNEEISTVIIGIKTLTESFIETLEMKREFEIQYFSLFFQLRSLITGLMYYDPTIASHSCLIYISELLTNAERKLLINYIKHTTTFLSFVVDVFLKEKEISTMIKEISSYDLY